MTNFATSYAAARRASIKCDAVVAELLRKHYPVTGDIDDQRAFERKEMMPFEMARVLVRGGVSEKDARATVTAFFKAPKYSAKPDASDAAATVLYNAYRNAITTIGRILKDAGIERTNTRADKGETKERRAPRSGNSAKASVPTPKGEVTLATIRGDASRFSEETTQHVAKMVEQWAALLTDAGALDAAQQYAEMVEKAGFIFREAIKEAPAKRK